MNSRLPTWAPRIDRRQVERFYKQIGEGITDEEAIEDLGISLYARCESILTVMNAMQKKVACVECDTQIQRKRGSIQNETLTCAKCGWTCEWLDYRNTFDEKFLNAGGMQPFCAEYVKAYHSAKTPGDKIVLIDTLIHRFHGELRGGNKPGAYAFIEGEPSNIAAFLDRLTYGDQIPKDVIDRRKQWRKTVGTSTKFWSDQLE